MPDVAMIHDLFSVYIQLLIPQWSLLLFHRYLSKQEFLQRVDYRTWENERELRLATGRSKK